MRKPSDKKQRIIDAAIKLISEKGYHGATTALIAKEAGVSQGIIFHYFGSKEGLFYTLLKEKAQIYREEFEKNIGDEKNTIKKIEIAVLTYAKLVQREERFYEILIKQIRGSGLDFQKISKYGLMDCFNLIADLIREGIKRGIFRKIDVEIAATSLFGMMEYGALRWMIFGKKFSLAEINKKMLNIFLQGISKR